MRGVAPRRGQGARIAVVCSAHGFGHVARQMATVEALLARGAAPTLFTAAPEGVVRRYLPDAQIQPWRVDVGIRQLDGVTEDLPGTLAALPEICGEAAIDRLAGALACADAAIVDVAPAALEACRRADVPALAVGNFDWAWIYGRYAERATEPSIAAGFATWAARFSGWQAPHEALALSPGPGLYGFRAVEAVGLLGRRRPACPLPLPPGARSALISFGGFGLGGGRLDLDRLLPSAPGIVWVTSPPTRLPPRADVLRVEDVPYPALVAAVDAVVTKPGYGIFAEASLAGTPLVWVDRGAFPEAPSLEAAMLARGDVKIGADGVVAALAARWSRAAPAPVGGSAGPQIAERALALAADAR